MIIDREEHRALLRLAVENIPISGPAGHPELFEKVMLVRELLQAIGNAAVAQDPALEMLESR